VLLAPCRAPCSEMRIPMRRGTFHGSDAIIKGALRAGC